MTVGSRPWRPGLCDPTGFDHVDAIGEQERVGRVVRDQHPWAVELTEMFSEQPSDLGSCLDVERRERLVEQQQISGSDASARAMATRRA